MGNCVCDQKTNYGNIDTEPIIKSQIFFIKKIDNLPFKIPENIQNVQKNLGKYDPKDLDIETKDIQSDESFYQINTNNFYQGSWRLKTPHGKGAIYCEDWLLEGVFENGHTIYGRKIFLNGSYYEGEFENGEFCGKGKFITDLNEEFIGTFKNNQVHGFAKEIQSENTTYEGEFHYGKRQGKGKFISKEIIEYEGGNKIKEDVYEGDFYEDEFNGKGVYAWSDGRKYDGDWVNGKMEGKGTFTYKDGRKYIGEFKNDKKEGYGEFFYVEDKIWKGNWQNGKQEGEGVLIGSDNIPHKGIWSDGKRQKWID